MCPSLKSFLISKRCLKRLSERTETLIAILADVDWSEVHPEIAKSKDRLVRAQRNMDGHGSGMKDADVQEEIEKLEAFVTSSRFKYYDAASRDQ